MILRGDGKPSSPVCVNLPLPTVSPSLEILSASGLKGKQS